MGSSVPRTPLGSQAVKLDRHLKQTTPLSLSASACRKEKEGQLICECRLARTVDLKSLSLITVGNAIAQAINYY